MSSSKKYIEFLRINIEHDYFDSVIPIDLLFEDFSIMKKFEVRIIRKINDWIMYGPDSKVEDFKTTFKIITFKLSPQISLNQNEKKENGSNIDFIIKPLKPLFFYVTSSLKISQFTNKDFLNVKLDALEKYYEYILFFKKNDIDEKVIEIIDSLKTIEFNKPKLISYDNGQKALHFQSKNKIKLTRKSSCNLKIISRSEYGEKILLSNLNIPQPENISIISPYDAITEFYNI